MRPSAAVALIVFAAFGFGAELRAAPTVARAVCGSPGKPPCPLQAWMRQHMAKPYADRSFDELAGNAEALVALNPKPKEWDDWDELAREVTRGAKARDEVRTLHACTHCHGAHRVDYVRQYRGRSLNDPP